MKRVVFLLCILLTGCLDLHHHEQMAPHWTSSKQQSSAPAYTDDCFSEGGKIIIEGKYQRKNLYCTNPKLYCTDSTTRFATMDITINDTIYIPYDSLESAAYEIPLYLYHFKAGDSLRIVIRHFAGGTPKLLNPEVY